MTLISQNIGKNQLSYDAWGKAKTSRDESLFHGMFTYNVPVTMWNEHFNGVELAAFSNATSVNGKLNIAAGATLNDKTLLHSFRNPRYEPNRGHVYSSSMILPSPTQAGIRRFGYFTNESGAFFELVAGGLYAVVRTTVGGITSDDRYLLNTSAVDLTRGNIFDIQMQWRGVGNYKFFINLVELKVIEYLGTRLELTMYNPANPLAFECTNLGDNVVIECGCVDISSEGGKANGKTYGSVGIDNESGQVALTGFNTPVMAIRSKKIVNTLINTRDTLALLLSAYSDQKSFVRVWATRDFTAITENDDTWRDFGDGHLEYIQYDNPNIATPMSFNTAKAQLIFGSRVAQDIPFITNALFENRTSIYLTPGDMFIFTLHRENGGASNGGVTFEFAEEI